MTQRTGFEIHVKTNSQQYKKTKMKNLIPKPQIVSYFDIIWYICWCYLIYFNASAMQIWYNLKQLFFSTVPPKSLLWLLLYMIQTSTETMFFLVQTSSKNARTGLRSEFMGWQLDRSLQKIKAHVFCWDAKRQPTAKHVKCIEI